MRLERAIQRLTATRARRRALTAAACAAAATIAAPLLFSAAFQLLAEAAVTPAARSLPADSVVVDRTGAEIADVHPPGATRLPVPLTEIPATVQRAIVAVEDRHFWSEGAVDVGRLAAAAVSDIAGHGAQGASTLPMQLAKILYLTDDRSFGFKLEQIVLAQRMVERTPRPVILDDYLNDVYFGNGATGIQAAAHEYFGVDARALDLAQAAMLAGLPNAPTAYDPLAHPGAARARQSQVLSAMLATGDISAAQAAAAAHERLHLATTSIDDTDLAPAFVNRVISTVRTWLNVDPATGGLRISTTLDLAMQRQAQQSVTTQVSQLGPLHVTDGAAVEIDPSTGDVLAYVGSAGAGVPGSEYDMAAVPRQPGSSFKLFTYSTAIADRRASMVSQVLDGPLRLSSGGGAAGTQTWQPLDYDRTWHGPQPVERALGNSLNVPAIRVELVGGIPAIVGMARAMGVTTLGNAPQTYGPSLTIGTYPVPLWEMAQAGGVLAAGGVLHPARFVLGVARSDGTRLSPPSPGPRSVLDPQVAFVMNDMLSNDANRTMEFGAGSALTVDGHTVAAKTGTSESFRDNLTVGWTPHLVTATWVGNADDSAMHGTTGVTGAAPIWHDIMSAQLGGDDGWPQAPAGLLTQDTPWGLAYFLPGTDAGTGEPALMTLGATQGPHQHGPRPGPDGNGGPGGHHH